MREWFFQTSPPPAADCAYSSDDSDDN